MRDSRSSARPAALARFRGNTFCRTASSAQSGQYFCSPDLTVYSRPQAWQISLLPILRTDPADLRCLYSNFAFSLRSSLHRGQYLALGPPGNVPPQVEQVRSRMTLPWRAALRQSGQRCWSPCPKNSAPQPLHFLRLKSDPSHRPPTHLRGPEGFLPPCSRPRLCTTPRFGCILR